MVADWLGDLLACPRCTGDLTTDTGQWRCSSCGVVGSTTLGVADFLADTSSLRMAGGAEMDLSADQRLGSRLAEAAGALTAEELRRLAGRLRTRAHGSEHTSRWRLQAQARFNRRFDLVDAEGSADGGAAMLAKVDTKLAELGWPPVVDGSALEAGGGQGLYVPALSSRFRSVVFVDASLANVVLASAVARDLGLTNVAFVRADVMSLPFRSGRFHLVHQNGVIEHVSDPLRMVQEAQRVVHPDGHYVCVSPNRHSLMPEPHFRLPVFGLIPPPLRRRLVPMVRGLTVEESATDPRSLRQLRRWLRRAFGEAVFVYFLPRRLEFTARQTVVRRVVPRSLASNRVGKVVDYVLNVALLPVVPQHIAVARRAALAG